MCVCVCVCANVKASSREFMKLSFPKFVGKQVTCLNLLSHFNVTLCQSGTVLQTADSLELTECELSCVHMTEWNKQVTSLLVAWCLLKFKQKYHGQECIPAGCLQSAAVAFCLAGEDGVSAWPGGCLPGWGVVHLTPWTDRQIPVKT